MASNYTHLARTLCFSVKIRVDQVFLLREPNKAAFNLLYGPLHGTKKSRYGWITAPIIFVFLTLYQLLWSLNLHGIWRSFAIGVVRHLSWYIKSRLGALRIRVIYTNFWLYCAFWVTG
ncbi:hypothetical protein PoMZ_05134 [Pyricularia oryzae]|uniref:Uncharacterized protein n=1 Tax=Pyricularia oryzae TaxID=318829 RepID=A0A4P7NMK5_PYROR|nr:hypothetical protein PoMZ_05134 [Pyricularia oryzae]